MDTIYTPNKDYKVLVYCMAYNQSKYIEETLNGFTMQKTNFSYVCLVIDDCSTDGEQDVIRAWMERECDMSKAEFIDIELSNIILVPHKANSNCNFAFYLLKRNLWKEQELKNSLVTPWHEHCEYDAFCEGDDYWTSETKLQVQADFMDQNPDVSCTFHNALVIYQNSNKASHNLNNFNTGYFSIADIVLNWHISLASYMIKSDVFISEELDSLNKVSWGSYTYLLAAAMRGKTYGFSESMSVYRKNDGGVTNNMSKSESVKRHFAMMNVIGDKAAINANEKRHYMWLLKTGLIKYIRGEKDAKESVKTIRQYNSNIYYMSIITSPISVFIFLVRFLKKLIHKRVTQLAICFFVGYIISSLMWQSYGVISSKLSDCRFDPCKVETTDEFNACLRDACLNIIRNESWSVNNIDYRCLLLDINSIKNSSPSVWDYGEYGLLMHYCLLYGFENGDTALVEEIKTKFNSLLKRNAELIRPDQSTYGLVALDLYNKTKEEKYKLYAEKVYNFLVGKAVGDIVYYGDSNNKEQRVDGIGLMCPFLYAYSRSFNNSKAKVLADKMLFDYIEWGTDYETGFPCKAYNTTTHIKMHHANWSRSISWYSQALIAKMDYDNEFQGQNERVSKFNQFVLQNRENNVPKYMGGAEKQSDASALIPMWFYMYRLNHDNLNKNDLFHQIKPFFDAKCIMRFGSGSAFDIHDMPNSWTTNLAVQGLTLYFISILN